MSLGLHCLMHPVWEPGSLTFFSCSHPTWDKFHQFCLHVYFQSPLLYLSPAPANSHLSGFPASISSSRLQRMSTQQQRAHPISTALFLNLLIVLRSKTPPTARPLWLQELAYESLHLDSLTLSSHTAPATRFYVSYFCFLKHAKFFPSSGPLHALLPLPGTASSSCRPLVTIITWLGPAHPFSFCHRLRATLNCPSPHGIYSQSLVRSLRSTDHKCRFVDLCVW